MPIKDAEDSNPDAALLPKLARDGWWHDPEQSEPLLGNTELRAIQESLGIMVNYRYDHDSIENNHEAFARGGTIVRCPDVDALMQGPA